MECKAMAPTGRLAEMWAWMLRMYFCSDWRVERNEDDDCGRKMWRWVRESRIMVFRDSLFASDGWFGGLWAQMDPRMISRSRRREKELLRSKRMTAVFLPPVRSSSYVEGRSS